MDTITTIECSSMLATMVDLLARKYDIGTGGITINRLFDILLEAGCHQISAEFSDHGGNHGATLYFEKTSKSFF